MHRVNAINVAGLGEPSNYAAVEPITATHRVNHWMVSPCLGNPRMGEKIRSR